MTLILMHHWGRANGVLTSIIDLYNNLSKYRDVKLRIAVKDVGKFILLCKRNNYFGYKDILTCITTDNHFEADTIITSTKTLNDPITMDYNKLILIDSLDIVKAHYGLIPMNEKMPNTTLLCNPANFDLVYYDHIEYYHKFSPERLQYVTTCKHLEYMRMNKSSIHITGSLYFENIGKCVFETLYKENTVTYRGDDTEDGLYYYLKLFGVDGNQDQRLSITPEQIEEHLFMKDNDAVLELI